MTTQSSKNDPSQIKTLINLMGIVYLHGKTSDGGDIYLTEYGQMYANLLRIENWYEKKWFETKRERLTGTSSIFKLPTKEINGRKLILVVKNCRVGEDVPVDTQTLEEFVNAEFNSPWEEFSLVFEMRDGKYGPKDITIKTQQPLAIYVPPEKLQLWQTGRSRTKINKIFQRHPGIVLDILRQYKLIYRWIEGLNIIEALEEIGIGGDELLKHLTSMNSQAIEQLKTKGYIVADMKPQHIIIDEDDIQKMRLMTATELENKRSMQMDFLHSLIDNKKYSLIDYELLDRTSGHEVEVKQSRRHSYLDIQNDRFKVSTLPPFLRASEIFDVPYIHGHVESTGGLLWVVGRNPLLFDYFVPERWRKTPYQPLSEKSEVYYTMTKDNVHIVWKTSRVGEKPRHDEAGVHYSLMKRYGFNSPFEEFALANFLMNNGIPTVNVRAIYMAGSDKIERVRDKRRYKTHAHLRDIDNEPILKMDHNYITIRGYYNGPDSWVATHEGNLFKPFDLQRAFQRGIISYQEAMKLLSITRQRLRNVGYDGTLLMLNDILITLDQNSAVVMDKENLPETRICNFRLLHKF